MLKSELNCQLISFVGKQTLSIITPLSCIVNTPSIKLKKLHLLYTPDVESNKNSILKFCKDKNYPFEIEAVAITNKSIDADIEIFKKQLKEICQNDDACLFYLQGGQNKHIDPAILELDYKKSYLLSSSRDSVKLFKADEFTNELQLNDPDELAVDEILKIQGVKYRFSKIKEVISENEVEIKENDFTIPSIATACLKGIEHNYKYLQNLVINNQHFDLCWNSGYNRLSFISSLVTYKLNNNKTKALAYLRKLAEWSNNKDKSFNLYDRTLYIPYTTIIQKEHLEKETTFNKNNLIDCTECITNKCFINYEKLTEVIKAKCFTPKSIKKPNITSETLNATKYVIQDDSLIFWFSDSIAALNCIETFKPKHVVICYTPQKEKDFNIFKSRLANQNYSIDGVASPFEGNELALKLEPLTNQQNVIVCPTFGTKQMGVFLTIWAKENNAQIWSMEGQRGIAKKLNSENEETRPFLACDLYDALQAKKGSDEQDLTYSMITDEERDIFKNLLKLCNYFKSVPCKKWVLTSYNANAPQIGIKLSSKDHFDAEINKKRSYFKLSVDGQEPYEDIKKTGGEWFEALTSYAFEEAFKSTGKQFKLYPRVRNPYTKAIEKKLKEKYKKEKEFHLTDIDVLGSFDGYHFLISCKARNDNNYNDPQKRSSSIKFAVAEALAISSGIGRFTIPILCHLACKKAYFEPIDQYSKVLVIGENELCNKYLLLKAFNKAVQAFNKN